MSVRLSESGRHLPCLRLLGALLMCTLSVATAAPKSRPVVGETPPDALGRDRDGNEQAVSGHRGKVVIVTFWASWCGPCRRELPVLGKFQRAVGRDHLEVIAVNVKEPRRDYLTVIRENKEIDLTWVHDSTGIVSVSYGVETLPNMFIIDSEGRIAHIHRGYSTESIDTFVREISALLPPEVLQRPAGS